MNQAANRLIGKMIRGYCLEELLACDDACATYRARTQELWQIPELIITVLLLPEYFSSEKRSRFRERFLQEAQRIATLRHHYLLPLYGCGEQDGLLYMLGPYMAGETLADQLQQHRRWTPEQALSLLNPLATVLDYIHEQGLAYQYLEPAHIILQSSVTIQLAGLGKRTLLRRRGLEEENQPLFAYEHLKSITGAYLGVPQYIAPEVLKGAEADRRSDVYSLGVLLCELLSGRPVFEERDYVAVVEKHVREPLPPLRELAPDLPASLELVLNRALARNPERRFQRPAALLNAYSQMLDLRVQTPAPVALVQQVKQMFSLTPAVSDTSFYLPTPRPTPPGHALLPAPPERIVEETAEVTVRSFSAPVPPTRSEPVIVPTQPEPVIVPTQPEPVIETMQPEPVMEEKSVLISSMDEETVQVKLDQGAEWLLDRSTTGSVPLLPVQEDETAHEKLVQPFEDIMFNPFADADEEETVFKPVGLGEKKEDSQAINDLDDTLLKTDPPLSNPSLRREAVHEMTPFPQQGDVFGSSIEWMERPFSERQESEVTSIERASDVPRKVTAAEKQYSELADQMKEVVTDEVTILPVSSAGIEEEKHPERPSSITNTDAILPSVQSTRTHMMAMASQLQELKERLQEKTKATGIRKLDDRPEMHDKTVRQA